MTELLLDRVSVVAGKRELLRDVSLTLDPGELVVLVGPNGAGKTTLLRVALGLLRPTSGKVTLDGREVSRMAPRDRAVRIAWLPQHQNVAEALPVHEVVSAARYRFGESKAEAARRAASALERVGATALADARINHLSGGERQRVFLAALIAQEAKLALLDEPASHLDPAQQLETYRVLGELSKLGMGILLVTHDVNLVAELSAPDRIRVIGLGAGSVAFRTTYTAADLPDRLSELFAVPFAAISHQGRRIFLPGSSSERSTS